MFQWLYEREAWVLGRVRRPMDVVRPDLGALELRREDGGGSVVGHGHVARRIREVDVGQLLQYWLEPSAVVVAAQFGIHQKSSSLVGDEMCSAGHVLYRVGVGRRTMVDAPRTSFLQIVAGQNRQPLKTHH